MTIPYKHRLHQYTAAISLKERKDQLLTDIAYCLSIAQIWTQAGANVPTRIKRLHEQASVDLTALNRLC